MAERRRRGYVPDGERLGDGLADTDILIAGMDPTVVRRILQHPAISTPRHSQ
jgi:hypothetical protein